MGNYNMLADYQRLNPDFQQRQSPAISAASSVLPYVQAGMSGVGLLASLYGNIQAGDIAEQNFEAQQKELARQHALEDSDRARALEQQRLVNMTNAAHDVNSEGDRRLAKYAGYFRQIGL